MKRHSAGVLLSSLLVSAAAIGADLPKVEVSKSATCGCFGRWADHMRQQGFSASTRDVADVAAERRWLRMPESESWCHAAVVSGYAIEGHVPASDVKRLLTERPKALGLAVPDMPNASPGMESSGAVPYPVHLVQTDGAMRTFANY